MQDKKQLVVEKLKELGAKVELMESGPSVFYKKVAYFKAASAIEKMSLPLTKAEQVKDIPGVGEKIFLKVSEILSTGTLSMLDNFTNDFSGLLKIGGVGPVKAKQLFNVYGVKTAAEVSRLIRAGKIVDKKLALNVQRALLNKGERILRTYILEISTPIELELRTECPKAIVQTCGSIRRGLSKCKDIDMIFCADPDIIEAGKRKFLSMDWDHVMAVGNTRLDAIMKGVAVNIRFMAREEYGSALLYFTGSGEFNKAMRTIAKNKGFKLSEYGLFRGKKIVARWLEEDIFKALGYKYIPPEKRVDGSVLPEYALNGG